MSTMMLMEWDGVTPDQYAQVLRTLDLDKTPPRGGVFHAAGFTGGVMYVVDIWESQQMFERFQADRLTPAVENAGLTTPPEVRFIPLHNMYVPNLEMIRKTGSTAMPIAA